MISIDSILTFLYLALPKFNIVEVGTYGLRLQDLISIVMVTRLSFKTPQVNAPTLLFIIYAIALISIGVFINPSDAILDLFRLAQYALIGKFFAKTLQRNPKLIDPIIACQLLLALLQFALILPNFDTGRGAIFSQKYAGSFGVSSEFSYAMILLMMIRYEGAIVRLSLTTLFVLNGTTTALLAYISAFRASRKISNLLIYVVAVGGSFILPFAFLDVDALDLAGKSVKSIMDIKVFAEGEFQDGDLLSLVHRSTKAIGILEVFLANPIFSIFGLGFGAVFTPADFGFVRLFANFGIIGLYVFYRAFRFLRTDIFLAVIVCNLLFDGIWSSTIGPLIAAIYFMYTARRPIAELSDD